ncbi:acetyl-CoA synthetase-like protein [Dichomitus squalens LYAD-421 SS1]|uniref:acetyl-CoA synthetase-like protein n=1 Tax=Dichomitus squalens (strain LYAD-421) TaxID=732165 RepID=UPI0004411A2B|nr:acetyl-CoA synthetase-like protein [Dichomitus squalens LYAD-421 SS1]EJF66994.1 acetyl-CoA synthetase-like protein [Dichomitus squalens LYAD-421 SS1]
MASYRTHLTVLEQTAARYPDSPVFRIPRIDSRSNEILEWDIVTYSQFWQDVERFARHWTQKLTSCGVGTRSVVGLWLGGVTYVDAVHIYGIARAGYIPQYFSLRLPNPDIIFELLEKSNGRALIYDSSYASTLSHAPVPTFVAIDARTLPDPEVSLPPNRASTNGEDTLMIFHTSGSTSGRPKLVPVSYSWWDFILAKIHEHMKPSPARNGRQDVTVWMGSMCHFGQSFMLAGMIQHGSCTVQFTQQAFSSDELVDMFQRCGLSRINIFPTFLSQHLRNSRQSPKLLALLQSLDNILISGLMMSSEDEEWVYSNGIKLTNCYGNTEVGSMLVTPASDLDTPASSNRTRALTPVPGSNYLFVPIDTEADSTAHAEAETVYANANAQLLELIVHADSPDCPDRSLRHEDGHYHTGDLFVEVSPGRYVYRGRNDDWIKSENSLRCDTKAIEDNVLATCGDLVAACIVTGNGRPSPALFVESADAGADPEKLKRDIIRRIRPFHSRRYMHERIVSPQFVLAVPRGTLPRTATKGNIRRRAVEEAFKAELDCVYGVAR